LLVERGLADSFRPLVVVTAPEDVQVARAARRSGLSEAEAESRIRAQLPLAEKTRVADWVIDNAADLDALIEKADRVLDRICADAGVDPGRYPRPPD
jgi:dephospho-CoA kinase